MRRSRCLPIAVLLLWGGTARADEPVMLDASDDPSAQLAEALSGVLAQSLPTSAVAVLFRDCAARTTCAGQMPSWFSHPSWLRGIERGGLPLVPLESTVGRATLNRIDQTLQGQPEARITTLLDELAYADTASTLFYIRPESGGTSSLIVWSVHDAESRAELANGTLEYGLAPLEVVSPTPAVVQAPMLSPEATPAPRRALPWLGAGVGLLGAAGVGWTWRHYQADPTIILTTGDAARIRNPYVLANTLGWAGLATGVAMVTVPILKKTSVTDARLHLSLSGTAQPGSSVNTVSTVKFSSGSGVTRK